MATVDSINRYDHEDFFESLGYDFATRAEARKTLEFEITNEAYEYSGLLRRMLQSNRDAETTESTEDSPQIYSVSDQGKYFVSGVSSSNPTTSSYV